MRFEGPLPPPKLLGYYGEVVEDAPHRIIRMAEKNQDALIAAGDHAMRMERRGQVLGWSLAVLFLVSAGFLVYQGSASLGGTTLLATIGAVAAALFRGARRSR